VVYTKDYMVIKLFPTERRILARKERVLWVAWSFGQFQWYACMWRPVAAQCPVQRCHLILSCRHLFKLMPCSFGVNHWQFQRCDIRHVTAHRHYQRQRFVSQAPLVKTQLLRRCGTSLTKCLNVHSQDAPFNHFLPNFLQHLHIVPFVIPTHLT